VATSEDRRDIVSFTKVALPFGWLGNMSPYTIRYAGDEWATAEALFQALRFEDETIQTEIWEQTSPMAAKMIAKRHKSATVIEPMGEQDVENMGLVLMLKIEQHSEIRRMLLDTANARIIEDSTKRRGAKSALFWGAALADGEWQGKNTLGNLWMELREEIRRREW